MNSRYVRFDIDVPQRVVLASEGKPVRGAHNELLWRFLIVGGVMDVPPGVRKFFVDRAIKPGDHLTLTRTATEHGGFRWTVEKQEVPATWGGASSVETGLFEQYPENPADDELLSRSLRIAMAAAREGELFGQRIGYTVSFTSADIRLLALVIRFGFER